MKLICMFRLHIWINSHTHPTSRTWCTSDDELGIPNSGDGLWGFEDNEFTSGDGFSSLCDKLWELEDERANYYAFLQSELFLGGY